MKAILNTRSTVAAALLFALSVPAALASSYCTEQPREKWIKAEEVRARLEQQGFQVRRLKIDDNCYEADATDRDGRRVKIQLDPVTGKAVRTEVKSKGRS